MMIVVLFNLKPGVDVAAYEDWARKTDLPTVRALVSVNNFDLYRTTGLLGTEGKPPYAYIELIQVNDMEQFGRDAASETMTRVAGELRSFADNPVFILTERIGEVAL